MEKCAAPGCPDKADPRWYLHYAGKAYPACDGHGCGGRPGENCAWCSVVQDSEDARDRFQDAEKLGTDAFDALYEWMTTTGAVVPADVLSPLTTLKEHAARPETPSKIPDGLEEKRVEVGSHHVVVIDKLFGPLIACDLRIFIDPKKGEWVVERLHESDEGIRHWEEMTRFDCQESLHYEE